MALHGGELILDPCIGTGRKLACFFAPWDNRIVLLHLTRSPEGNPWGVELGTRCRR